MVVLKKRGDSRSVKALKQNGKKRTVGKNLPGNKKEGNGRSLGEKKSFKKGGVFLCRPAAGMRGWAGKRRRTVIRDK